METVKLSRETVKRMQALGVGIVYFFGSRAEGTSFPHSDYDIGVVFVEPRKVAVDGFDLSLKLYDILSRDIPEQLRGPRLDISLLDKANPALQIAAVIYGKSIYQRDPEFRADYEERVLQQYDDYRSLKEEYEQATTESFRKPTLSP